MRNEFCRKAKKGKGEDAGVVKEQKADPFRICLSFRKFKIGFGGARANYLPVLAGAEMGFVSSSTERECVARVKRIVNDSEVSMKMIADQVVSRVSTLAAARGPKAVCEP